MAKAALVATALTSLLLAPGAALAADGEVTLVLVSDTTWTVDDADTGVGPTLSLPGAAQLVCLNASTPTGCPAGATVYGWGGGGWGADLSGFPGAWWMWAPGISGSTEGADGDTYTFTKTVNIPGTPTAGSVSIAADDSASVAVNGTTVGSSTGQNALASHDITAQLVAGDNTIVVTASNGTFCSTGNAPVCIYSSNPAGVAVGVSITYTTPASPAPTDPPTSTVVGQAGGSGIPALSMAILALGLAAAIATFALAPRRRPGHHDSISRDRC